MTDEFHSLMYFTKAMHMYYILGCRNDVKPVRKDYILMTTVRFPPTVVGTLAQAIYDNATHKSAAFAIEAACVVASSIAQGKFITPMHGVLGTYSVLVAEVGDGKSYYLNAAHNVISQVVEQLKLKNSILIQDGNSITSLKDFNCRALILHEGFEWIMNSQIEQDLIAAYSGEDFEDVKNPRLSIFCETNTKTFSKDFMLQNESMLSRFSIIRDTPQKPESFLNYLPFLASEKIIEALCAPVAEWKIEQQHLKKLPLIISWSDAVRDQFDKYGLEKRKLAKSSRHEAVAFARCAEKAIRIASTLAAFDGERVESEHLEWTIEWLDCHDYLAIKK